MPQTGSFLSAVWREHYPISKRIFTNEISCQWVRYIRQQENSWSESIELQSSHKSISEFRGTDIGCKPLLLVAFPVHPKCVHWGSGQGFVQVSQLFPTKTHTCIETKEPSSNKEKQALNIIPFSINSWHCAFRKVVYSWHPSNPDSPSTPFKSGSLFQRTWRTW